MRILGVLPKPGCTKGFGGFLSYLGAIYIHVKDHRHFMASESGCSTDEDVNGVRAPGVPASRDFASFGVSCFMSGFRIWEVGVVHVSMVALWSCSWTDCLSSSLCKYLCVLFALASPFLGILTFCVKSRAAGDLFVQPRARGARPVGNALLGSLGCVTCRN